jgi:hypothetical protein
VPLTAPFVFRSLAGKLEIGFPLPAAPPPLNLPGSQAPSVLRRGEGGAGHLAKSKGAAPTVLTGRSRSESVTRARSVPGSHSCPDVALSSPEVTAQRVRSKANGLVTFRVQGRREARATSPGANPSGTPAGSATRPVPSG